MENKLRLYCNLLNEDGDLLTVRHIEGRRGLKAMVSALRQQLAAGDIIFVEESGGDPLGTGAVTAEDIARMLNLEQFCRKYGLDYSTLKNHIVPFSSYTAGSHSFIDLYKAETGDAGKIGLLPDNHPFSIMTAFAQAIWYPIPANGGPGVPGEEAGPGEEFFRELGLSESATV